MTSGALVAAFAPNFGILLAARIFQGAGAAAVPTLGVAIVSARYTGCGAGSVALGRVAGIAAAVSCLGPLAGGGIEALLGWRAVFALPMLGALLVPLLWRSLPTTGSGARLDLFGAVLVAGTAAGAVLLVQSPSTGPVVAGVGAALLLLGVPSVALWVRRRPHGFLPRSVIRNAIVVRSALAAASVPAAWFALLIAVPAVLVGTRLGAVAGRASRCCPAPPPGCSRHDWPARCCPGSARPARWRSRPWSRPRRSSSRPPGPRPARPCCWWPPSSR